MTRSSLGVYALGAATLLVAGYAAATDVRSAGQVPVEGRAVLAVDQRFNAAILANDTAVFNAVLAPEYLFITSTGSVRTPMKSSAIMPQATLTIAYTALTASACAYSATPPCSRA